MRTLLLSVIGCAAFVSAQPAAANCWSNKAICQAICGFDCCSAANFAAPQDQRALSQISLDDLKAELEGMRVTRADKAFVDAVNAEIKSRGGTAVDLKSN